MRWTPWIALALLLPCAAQEEPNAADLYRQVLSQVQFDKDAPYAKEIVEVCQKGWDGEHKTLLDLLAKNALALDNLKGIGEWKRCEFLAGVKVTFDTDLSHLASARSLARLAVTKGRLEASQGHLPEAVGWYLRTIRLAQGVANDHCLISRLIETALIRVCLPGLTDAVRDPKCDEATLAEVERVLADYIGHRLPFSDAMAAEERMMQQAADNAFLVEQDPSRMPEETRKMTEEIKKADKETRKRWHDECQKLFEEYFDKIRKSSVPGHLGELRAIRDEIRKIAEAADSPPRILFAMLMPGFSPAAFPLAKTEAGVDAVRIIAALSRYRGKQKKLPEALTDLVATYLPSVPVDPFDGRPFRYAKDGSGCRIWSVGPDLTDDGGKKPCDDSKEDEPGTDMIWELK